MRTEETGGGWLVDQDVLHHQRAPGTTCLSALYEGGRGTPVKPLNDSKGCGGVMRVAPIALVTEHRFATAARAAALTHGHPSGYLSAGAFAHVVGELLRGATLPDAIASARVELAQWPDHDETMRSIDAAVAQAASGNVSAERIETLGGGWVGEEALAIGLCCALVAPDVRSGLELAVNHSGDSDSTGSIAGNLLGALLRRRRAACRPARPARRSPAHRDRGERSRRRLRRRASGRQHPLPAWLSMVGGTQRWTTVRWHVRGFRGTDDAAGRSLARA